MNRKYDRETKFWQSDFLWFWWPCWVFAADPTSTSFNRPPRGLSELKFIFSGQTGLVPWLWRRRTSPVTSRGRRDSGHRWKLRTPSPNTGRQLKKQKVSKYHLYHQNKTFKDGIGCSSFGSSAGTLAHWPVCSHACADGTWGSGLKLLEWQQNIESGLLRTHLPGFPERPGSDSPTGAGRGGSGWWRRRDACCPSWWRRRLEDNQKTPESRCGTSWQTHRDQFLAKELRSEVIKAGGGGFLHAPLRFADRPPFNEHINDSTEVMIKFKHCSATATSSGVQTSGVFLNKRLINNKIQRLVSTISFFF